MEFDFGGYATKYDQLCSDGHTIISNAFAHQDGKKVPLVWRHDKDRQPGNVLGHAILEARNDGIYARAKFNNNRNALEAKESVMHGDLEDLSIHANRLRKVGMQVQDGNINEVSLVMHGANPGAFIDFVSIQHEDGSYEERPDEAVIYTGLGIEIAHEDDDTDEDSEETIGDVFNTLNDKQKDAVYAMIAQALESDEAKHSDDDLDEDEDEEEDLEHQDKDGSNVTHNIFANQTSVAKGADGQVIRLTKEQMHTIMHSAEDLGSLEKAILQHADEYGVTDIDYLFPEHRNVRTQPDWVKRRTEWVNSVLGGVHKTPFSRIKSMSADITQDTARAKGYIKTRMKKEEFFGLQKRTTGPQTIYKKQKLDRDDIIDITSFDIVEWVKGEMRLMLEEELARAILIGDGREIDDEDKIKDPASIADGIGIRSIANDHTFYAHQVEVPANTSGESLIEAVLRQRKNYKGTGNPTFYTTEDLITDLLLLKDKMGRRLYRTVADLAAELRVASLVAVEVMEGHEVDGRSILGVMVNLADYSLGADKGGETTFFDDFDIDFNQYKYLYELRTSGALTLPKSAMVVWRAAGTSVTPDAPTFNSETNTITIPSKSGVVYYIGDDVVTGSEVIEDDTTVEARPDEGFYFPPNTTRAWEFQYVGE